MKYSFIFKAHGVPEEALLERQDWAKYQIFKVVNDAGISVLSLDAYYNLIKCSIITRDSNSYIKVDMSKAFEQLDHDCVEEIYFKMLDINSVNL